MTFVGRAAAMSLACVLAPSAGVQALEDLPPVEGLFECGFAFDDDTDSLAGPVDAEFDGRRGEVLVELDVKPWPPPNRGMRLLDVDGTFVLRAAQTHPVAAWIPLSDDVVLPNPYLVSYELVEREIALEPVLAELIRDVVTTEIARAPAQPEGLVCFDCDSYTFEAGGRCATTHSADDYTRSGRLVDAFQALEWAVALPGPARVLALGLAAAKLRSFADAPPPQVQERLAMLIAGLLLVLFFALPVLIAAPFAFLPRRVPRPAKFMLVSGALAYGSTVLFCVALLPLALGLVLVAAEREGDHGLSYVLYGIRVWLPVAIAVFWLYASFRWPGHLRASWPRIVG